MAFALIGTLNAQQITSNKVLPPMLNLEKNTTIVERDLEGPVAGQRGGGGILFMEDFANGFDGNNGFGEWTADDTAGEDIWEVATDAGSDGEWSGGGEDPIASETAENGWALFDADEYNTQFAGTNEGQVDGNETYQDVEGTLTAPALNFEGINAVVVSWYQYYRYCCSDDHPLQLEVSNDGGDSFTQFSAGGLIPAATNAQFNSQIVTVDISCVAANEADVIIRWAWRQPEGGGDSHYFWGIDDIVIAENETGNDLVIADYTSYTDYETTGTFEYGTWPFSQLTEIQPAANYQVAGTVPQPNSVLTVTAGDYTGTTEPQLLEYPTCVGDTLRTDAFTPAAEEATINVVYNLASDSTDATPDDNVRTEEFKVSEFIYARDNDEFSGVFPADGTQEFIAAAGYQMFQEATVYGIDVAIMNGSDPADVVAYILDADLEILEVTEEMVVNPDFLNNQNATEIAWTTLLFDDPVTLAADQFVAAGFNHFGGTEVQVGESQNVPPQTCFVNGDFGTAGFDWYFTTEAPMVRLNFNPNAMQTPDAVAEFEDEFGNKLFQNAPNPSNGSTRISFKLAQQKQVSIEIRDMAGRTIEVRELGNLAQGTYVEEFDVTNLEAGIYTYTLAFTDGGQVTRTMMVSK